MDADTVDRLIASLGEDLVLVGGQALAFWMQRYGVSSDVPFISNDGDALGARKAAEALAIKLGGKLLVPPASARTSLVAQVRLPRPNGKVANIDVLHLLYTTGGLKKSGDFTRSVIDRSVEIEIDGGVRFRVMDPFDVLDSRVQNAAGLLEQKGPHVITQARWAIQMASAVLLKMANGGGVGDTVTSRLGTAISGIYKLAHSHAGKALWKDHGIDVMAAVDVESLARLSPLHAKQLARVLEAQRTRQAATVEAKSEKSQQKARHKRPSS